MEEGGQVISQQQLMGLLALMPQQETAYDNTPLEEVGQSKAYDNTSLEEVRQPTISEIFESQGKTLGGNNTQSLSQMLGR